MTRISDGKRYRKSVNGADGISDIEGKVARVSGEEDGKRPSFNSWSGPQPLRPARPLLQQFLDQTQQRLREKRCWAEDFGS